MSGALPPISTGSPRQRAWAESIRDEYLRSRWGGTWRTKIDIGTWKAVARQTSARWWIDNRTQIGVALAEQNPLPPIVGGTTAACQQATTIRARLVAKRWGNKIPPGVQAALARLTDANWWISNAASSRDQAIDRALAMELPEHDRKRMMLGPLPDPAPAVDSHTGPCETRPDYIAVRQAAYEVLAYHGDERSAPAQGITREMRQTCCGRAGWRDGRNAGVEAWLDRKAAEIRRISPGMTAGEARTRAMSDRAWLMRSLDGWG